MNLVLWIVQGLLAAMMLGAGMFKIVTPRENFKESPIPAVVPLLLAIVIAVGRLALVPWA